MITDIYQQELMATQVQYFMHLNLLNANYVLIISDQNLPTESNTTP